MLFLLFITTGAWIVLAFLGLVGTLFGFFIPTLPSIPNGATYVFSNIYLLNSFLPVSDFFALAFIALAYKTFLFAWRMIFLVSHTIGSMVRYFVSIF